MADVPERLRLQVRERAGGRCEYCLVHESHTFARYEPDHITSIKHGGQTTLENLAWACVFCNRHKGSDIASIDPLTGRGVLLFNPRTQHWRRHFRLNGPRIEPLTVSGRATARLRQFNITARIEDRRDLMSNGEYP